MMVPGSMPACIGCGGTVGIRWGRSQRVILDTNGDGQPRRETISLQRWRCAGCGVVRTEAPVQVRQRSLASIAARDQVALACMHAGYSAAGMRYGVDEKTARSLWEEWAALRERSLVGAVPETVGLHVMRVGGADRTLITDVAMLTVVDMLQGVGMDDIETWLAGREGWRVRHASISPLPAYRDAVRAHAPDAVISFMPTDARLAAMRAWMGSFRVMSRGLHGLGRNARESVRVFISSRPSDLEREDMQGWDGRIVQLHALKNLFMNALADADLSGLRRASLDASAMGANLPLMFVDSWGTEICARGRHIPDHLMDSLRASISSRRPALCFSLMRGLLLLAGNPGGATDGDDTVGNTGDEPSSTSGIPIHQAVHHLSSRA